MINRVLKAWFGHFEKEELKKYLFLGFIYSLIVGAYWTLYPMKDSLFGQLIIGYGHVEGRTIFIALTKVISLILLFPAVIAYGSLANKVKKHHLFYVMVASYAFIMLCWAFFFAHPTLGLANYTASPYRIAGWLWYAFAESFSALVISVFWGFTADVSTAQSAKRGFALIVMLGHIGGAFIPLFLIKLPLLLHTTNVIVIASCSLLLFLAVISFKLFLKLTPADQLKGYQETVSVTTKQKKPHLMEGLKLLLTNNYLLGIFAITGFFQFATTIIDFNFNRMIYECFPNAELASQYYCQNGFWINIITLLCLILGINNIQRWLGLATALCLAPIILGFAIFALKIYPNLDMVFYCFVSAKVINFSLNLPSIKQLYVPTSKAAKYKSQVWIDSFSPNGFKSLAAGANMTKDLLGFSLYASMITVFSLGISAFWIFIALFLARKRNTAVKEKKLVC